MIFSHFSLRYLTTAVVNIFRIKTNEYFFSMNVCLAVPVNSTRNLPLLSKLIDIFIVFSKKKYTIQASFSKKVRIWSKSAWKRVQ